MGAVESQASGESAAARMGPEAEGRATPRLAVFTHDTFGLGHVRRCLHIVRALAGEAPQAAILFITGSAVSHTLGPLPANADYVKIPTIAKTGARGLQPPHLPVALAETALLRERLIAETIRSYAPDVFLVDNFPLGSQRELLPALKEIRRFRGRAVLGLRDIVDAPDHVRKEWSRQGVHDVLDRYYDRILVYGMKEVLDIAEAYGIPPRIAGKIRYCGYVTATAPLPLSPEEVRRRLGLSGPFLLATAGGGGDGFPLLQTLVEALPLLPGLSAVIFTGPLMSSSQRARLRARADLRPGVVVLDHVEDLRSYLAAADIVVSMCGYNIAAEIASLGVRAVVVPRTWKYGEHLNRAAARGEWEQILRAQALARLGLVSLLEPEELSPDRLASEITAGLARPRAAPGGAVDFNGLERVTHEILALASAGREATHGKQ